MRTKINKAIYALLIACSSLLFSACDERVDIVDGNIPDQYLRVVRPHLGNYVGTMNSRSGQISLNLALDGNRLVLSSNRDLIDSGCDSEIGHLKRVYVYQNAQNEFEVRRAVFAFAPNNCISIEGDELEFRLKTSSTGIQSMHASILERMDWHERCHIEYVPGGGTHTVCERIPDYSYIEGSFAR